MVRPSLVFVSIWIAIVTAMAVPASAGLPTIVYSNDFEAAAPGAEWSASCVDANCWAAVGTDCTSAVFCTDASGGANNYLGRAGPQTITLTLTGLPAHDMVAIEFDLFAINTWDGNDHVDDFTLSVAGGETLLGPVTFGHTGRPQSFPDLYPTANSHCDGAFECATLGSCCDAIDGGGVYTFPWDRYGTSGQTHPHNFVFAHTDSSITFNFVAGMSQSCTDECIGIDNVEVSVDETEVPVPELGTLLLLATGLVGIGALVTVRRRVVR